MIEKSYDGYVERMRRLADLSNASSLLHWDQEVYMPVGGNSSRARQLSTLSGMIYELQTDPEFVGLLNDLSLNEALTAEQKKNVEVSLKEINRKLLLDRNYVERLTLTSSKAYSAWINARKENNFSLFAPWLEKIIELKQEECQKIGFTGHPYDVLIDEYEPGMKTEQLDHLFSSLKVELEELILEIRNSKNAYPDTSFSHLHYPKEDQWNTGLEVIRLMGFDFNCGRQDVSEHPFTISLGLKDIRITTRIDENNLFEMLWSCIHEAGHGLYEQGFNADDYGLPKAEAASLGIHESQSRLWENHVGRGPSFWSFYFNKLKSVFPTQLKSVDEAKFYAAINTIKPSLIRTNADELTYHFHVIIRFELEKGLIDGTLKVAELPERWNELYKKYLQLDVPDDNSGILQDIHWSHGSFGYFPTYSLGSLYAAQFFHQANLDIPDLQDQIANGNFESLNAWLQNKVYSRGKHADSNELCSEITGEPINFNYFMDYAAKKYSQLFIPNL